MLKKPSVRYTPEGSKSISLYMQSAPLEKATRPNLDKQCKELFPVRTLQLCRAKHVVLIFVNN